MIRFINFIFGKKKQWCDNYECLCEDVQEITDYEYSCNLDCKNCEHCGKL